MDNIVTLTHKSTHCYLVGIQGGMLLIDTGWPDGLPAFQNNLKTHTVEAREIRFILFTHNHPDHAGGVQGIKQLSGARLLVHEKQLPYLASIPQKGGFQPIRVEKDDVVVPEENRALLKSLGIPGEILATPGHSEDSISLLLDSGAAFTGDLHPPDLVTEENAAATRASWENLLRHGARIIYPGHSVSFAASGIQDRLNLNGL